LDLVFGLTCYTLFFVRPDRRKKNQVMQKNLGPKSVKVKRPGISEKKTNHFKNDRLAVGTTPGWGLFCTVSFLFSKKELVQSQVAGQWVRHTCLTMPVKDMSLPSLKPIQSDLFQKISRKGRYLERTSWQDAKHWTSSWQNAKHLTSGMQMPSIETSGGQYALSFLVELAESETLERRHKLHSSGMVGTLRYSIGLLAKCETRVVWLAKCETWRVKCAQFWGFCNKHPCCISLGKSKKTTMFVKTQSFSLEPNLSAIVFWYYCFASHRGTTSPSLLTHPKDVKADTRFRMYRWSWRLQDRVVSSTLKELIIGIICHPQCLTQSTYYCPYHPTAESEANA
jgi:hypothetical protein